MEISNALLVDSKLNSKSAIAKIVDLESELPSEDQLVVKFQKKTLL